MTIVGSRLPDRQAGRQGNGDVRRLAAGSRSEAWAFGWRNC